MIPDKPDPVRPVDPNPPIVDPIDPSCLNDDPMNPDPNCTAEEGKDDDGVIPPDGNDPETAPTED